MEGGREDERKYVGREGKSNEGGKIEVGEKEGV